MDNTISFVGYSPDYSPDGTMKQALKHRKYNISLEDFYSAVNQSSSSGCSCCKQEDVKLYCIQPVGLPIKHNALSMCDECLKSLPIELTVINLNSIGAPPALISRQYESVV